jgi:predicted dehydrogenase
LWGLLRFPDGVVGSLEINWLTPTKIRETLVLGERGLFRVDDLTQDLYFFENAEASALEWSALAAIKGVSEGRMIRYAVQRYEPLKAEIQAFLKSAANNSPAPITGEDGLMALKLSLAIAESGKTHQALSL